MAPTISLHELYRIQSQRRRARVASYDRVLELCHRRVRTVAGYGGLNTFFEVPGLVVGQPLFDLPGCTKHIMASLRDAGFLVQLLPPPHVSVLYVSWDPRELAPPPAAPALLGPAAPALMMLPAPPAAPAQKQLQQQQQRRAGKQRERELQVATDAGKLRMF